MYNFSVIQSGKKGHLSPYDQIASEYDELFGNENPYYEAVNNCELELFQKWVRPPTQSRLALDVGCGTGFHTEWLARSGFQTTGIDNSEEMIRVAGTKSRNWKHGVEFKLLNVNEIEQLPKNSYAVILCFGSTLNHLENWRRVAQLVSERLVSGGLFLFSYDNVDGIDVLARVFLRQFSGYSKAYIRDILFGRVKARIRGESFNNHWRVHTKAGEIEVPLKYEHTKKWRAFLHAANLRIGEMRGTHVFDCFDRDLLEASAGIIVARRKAGAGRVRRFLRAADRVLARQLYRVAAHIVGVAIKS